METEPIYDIKKVRGKIVLVDDQVYEKELLKLALKRKNWEVDLEYFSNVDDAVNFLKNSKENIFLVVSDLNMPRKSGLDFQKEIEMDEQLRNKSIPFIFVSNGANKQDINDAYDYGVQGYFCKPMSVEEQAEIFDIIIKYWILSRHPNNLED